MLAMGPEESKKKVLGQLIKSRVYSSRGISFGGRSSPPDCRNDTSAVPCLLLATSPRQKSPKPRCSRGSPTITGHYAGAKFSEPPAAAALPAPPAHWTGPMVGPESMDRATHHLKLLLNVRA